MAIVPANRRTIWAPGRGALPARPIYATVSAATYGDGVTNAQAHIQSLLNSCPSDYAVYLPAGRYLTTGSLIIPSDRSLVGAGPTQTTLFCNAAGSAIFMGGWGSNGASTAVTVDVPRGATQITVASAAGITAGSLILIDQLDDTSYVAIGDATWYKRNSGGYRSMGQTCEVASVNGNVITIVGCIHHGYDLAHSPEVTVVNGYKNIGLESLNIEGGNNRVISVIRNLRSWIRDVEIDGSKMYANGGPLVCFQNSVRCTVSRTYLHHNRTYVNGSGSYGLCLQQQSSDNLVEDNIIVFMNKPLMFEASGGGNVVAYNCIDDAQISGSAWSETDIDTHASFPHDELIEGNFAPQIATDNTHGGSGWFTFFRNYARGIHRTGTYGGVIQSQNRVGIEVDQTNYYANLIGNVLLDDGASGLGYATPSSHAGFSVNSLVGARLGWHTATYTWEALVESTAYLHGNYDGVSGTVQWDPGNADHAIPDSLYLASKPAFFGSYEWPPVDPTAASPSARVKTLPAKARLDAGTPFADPPTGPVIGPVTLPTSETWACEVTGVTSNTSFRITSSDGQSVQLDLILSAEATATASLFLGSNAEGLPTALGSSSVEGTGQVTVGGIRVATGDAHVLDPGAVSSAGTKYGVGRITQTGIGSVTAAGVRVSLGQALVDAPGPATAVGSRIGYGDANVASLGDLTTFGFSFAQNSGPVDVSGVGEIQVTGQRDAQGGIAIVTGQARVLLQGVRVGLGDAAVDCTADIQTNGYFFVPGVPQGDAHVADPGVIVANGYRYCEGAAIVIGPGVVSAVGVRPGVVSEPIRIHGRIRPIRLVEYV